MMIMKDRLGKLYFSQNSMEIFKQCRMKFKKRYLDGLYWRNWLLDSEKTLKTEKGRLFHLLAYRYFLNINSQAGEDIGNEHEELKPWMESLKKFIEIKEDRLYFPEFELKLTENHMKLQAKFDLIVIDVNGDAAIYDWKVHDKPLNRSLLETSYQTVIYRYLLAKAGKTITGMKPELGRISMTYWQPSHPSNPVRIDYSEEQFKQDEVFLNNEIEKILNCDFDSPAIKTADMKICRFCEFCSICNNTKPDTAGIKTDTEFGLEWDEVDEIEF